MAVAAHDRRLSNISVLSLFGGHGAIARAGAARGMVCAIVDFEHDTANDLTQQKAFEDVHAMAPIFRWSGSTCRVARGVEQGGHPPGRTSHRQSGPTNS